MSSIPKVIWILWFQGREQAPYIVEKCMNSWIDKNPGWKVIILDSENLNDFVTIKVDSHLLDSLGLALKSDLIRLELLQKYGGVWADATTYCTTPLDEWIDESFADDFFAFATPGPDRLLANWFLVSVKNGIIVSALNKELCAYLNDNRFNKYNKFQLFSVKVLKRVLRRNVFTSQYWFSYFVRGILKVYPYLLFHYLFSKLYFADDTIQKKWDHVKKVSADIPHVVQHAGMLSKANDEIKLKIKRANAKLYKLSWKYDESQYKKDTTLYWLLEDG